MIEAIGLEISTNVYIEINYIRPLAGSTLLPLFFFLENLFGLLKLSLNRWRTNTVSETYVCQHKQAYVKTHAYLSRRVVSVSLDTPATRQR